MRNDIKYLYCTWRWETPDRGGPRDRTAEIERVKDPYIKLHLLVVERYYGFSPTDEVLERWVREHTKDFSDVLRKEKPELLKRFAGGDTGLLPNDKIDDFATQE